MKRWAAEENTHILAIHIHPVYSTENIMTLLQRNRHATNVRNAHRHSCGTNINTLGKKTAAINEVFILSCRTDQTSSLIVFREGLKWTRETCFGLFSIAFILTLELTISRAWNISTKADYIHRQTVNNSCIYKSILIMCSTKIKYVWYQESGHRNKHTSIDEKPISFAYEY